MEEILGLLAVVAALIFKVVEKKLSKAAESHKVEPVEPMPEPPQWMMPEPLVSEPLVREPMVKESLADLEGGRAVMPHKPIAERHKAEKRKPEMPEMMDGQTEKKKIDPKQLIIYSEIMNRKY